MQVHVKFFAIFREYVGLKEDWREIEPGTTVQELWNHYTANAKNPRVANIRAAFSVNQRLAKPETVLNGGEEVGFLPPVSGGAGVPKRAAKKKAAPLKTAKKTVRKTKRAPRVARRGKGQSAGRNTGRGKGQNARQSAGQNAGRGDPAPTRDFVVTDEPLSLDALVARVSHSGAGAIATFLGVVRDNANDRSVQYLEYEAYPELAERMLAQIGAEAHERWGEARVAIAHRVGRLQIGEASVVIAASAPHRAEAFSACRYAIERLKVVLPVWKKEFASDTDYWVEGPTAGEVDATQAEKTVARQESEFVTENAAAAVGDIRTDIESV